MKRLVFVLLVLFGLITSLSAKQRVIYQKVNEEVSEKELFSDCISDMKVHISLGWEVVAFSFTEEGYIIVYEDYE